MQNEYLPLLLMMMIAGLIGVAMVFLSWFLGPKKTTPYKEVPYECGVTPYGTAREKFPIKFYLVAMLFILFDIEVVFLWSWLAVFKDAALDYQIYSFWAVMIYFSIWIIGDIYILRVHAIDWDEPEDLQNLLLKEKGVV